MAKILVEAIEKGADATGIRRPGDRFEIEEAIFSSRWMKKVGGEKTVVETPEQAPKPRSPQVEAMLAARAAKRAANGG